MKELRLPLKTKWFDLTKAGIKTEDYREVNKYWCKRLLWMSEQMCEEYGIMDEMIDDIRAMYSNPRHRDMAELLNFFEVKVKQFDCNTMTLGYPKSDDNSRILKLAHKGIEIRMGNPEWGAEPNKLYFVILHGDILIEKTI